MPSKIDKKIDEEKAVQAAIAAMPEPDRVIAEKIDSIVKANAPDLTAKLWYGMPAYFKDGQVVCFFQGAAKFKTRYATFGFEHEAQLDDGEMWPVAFAITKMTPAAEKMIVTLVKKAAKIHVAI